MSFIGEMGLTTLGKGLVKLNSECSRTEILNALINKCDICKVRILPTKVSNESYDLVFKSVTDNDVVHVICDESQEFFTIQGNLVNTKGILGKRIESIGKSEVICIEVHRRYHEPEELYSLYNADSSFVDYCYINGIKIKLENR